MARDEQRKVIEDWQTISRSFLKLVALKRESVSPYTQETLRLADSLRRASRSVLKLAAGLGVECNRLQLLVGVLGEMHDLVEDRHFNDGVFPPLLRDAGDEVDELAQALRGEAAEWSNPETIEQCDGQPDHAARGAARSGGSQGTAKRKRSPAKDEKRDKRRAELRRLWDEGNHDHESLAKLLKVDRSTVSRDVKTLGLS